MGGSVKKSMCGSKGRLLGMLGLTFSFMLVELVVGNLTNSMALVADSFHMLSDVIALAIAFVSVKLSPKSWSKNSFGWARAEVVGALINAVFLLIVLIICVSTWPLLRDSTLILLNSLPPHIDLADLRSRLVSSVSGVLGVHELHVWQLVGRRVVASCHLELMTSPKENPEDLNRQVKEFFHKEGIHSTTIQMEFGSPGDGSCQHSCPATPGLDPSSPGLDCREDTCCRTDTTLGQDNEATDIDIVEKM